jgi:hypothetical protein
MNEQAKKAFEHYKQMVSAWEHVNGTAHDNGHHLIRWIMTQETASVNWESILSGFPSDALQVELSRRYREMAINAPRLPMCPCGEYMVLEQHGNLWGCSCECVIGQDIMAPYTDSPDEAIAFARANIKEYIAKNS